MTDLDLYGPPGSNGFTATPKGSSDGTIMLTWIPAEDGCDGDTALLTVRGKDHDLTADQLRALARAATRAADSIEGRASVPDVAPANGPPESGADD